MTEQVENRELTIGSFLAAIQEMPSDTVIKILEEAEVGYKVHINFDILRGSKQGEEDQVWIVIKPLKPKEDKNKLVLPGLVVPELVKK